MKRIVILVAGAACGATALAQPAMEHILVSVPIHRQEAETALPVTVLSGDELQQNAAATLGETLAGKPGLANASFGPGVGRPVIRGQQGPRTITLQNGISSADTSSLSPDHSVAVESLLADSIEVLRGPSALLYGGGAIGGVVNVIDNRIPLSPPQSTQGALEYRRDSAADLDNLVLRVEGGGDKVAYLISASGRRSHDLEIPGAADSAQAAAAHGEDTLSGEEPVLRGRIANTDTDSATVTAGLSYPLGHGSRMGFAVSRLESEYGIPAGTHRHDNGDEDADGHEDDNAVAHPNNHEDHPVRIDLEQTRYDAMLHLHAPLPGIDILRAFVAYTDYGHRELEGGDSGTDYDRDTVESRLELAHGPLLGMHGVLGMQWREDRFVASGDEALVPKTRSGELGLFLVEDLHRGDWTFEFGLRGDRIQREPRTAVADDETFFNLSYSASALWQVDRHWSTGLSLSHAERAPSTEELYSNVEASVPSELVEHAATGVIAIGDNRLDAERSLNADFSLNWRSSQLDAELALFYNRFRDYIHLQNSEQTLAGVPLYHYKQGDARFYGVEFDSEWRLLELAQGNIALGLSGDRVIGRLDGGSDVPRLPPQRLNAQLRWHGERASGWLRVQRTAAQDDPGDFEAATDGYTRWDLGADYRWRVGAAREVLLFLKWKNIGDEEIRLSTSFLRDRAPEAGRSLEAGLRYTF